MAEEQYQEQYVEQPNYYSQAPVNMQRNDKADLLEKIKPDLIVEVIRHKLMGEEMVDGIWTKIDVLQDKSLTQRGAWDIANLMLGVSSQNVSLSKLSDSEIRARAFNIASTAVIMCVRNHKTYFNNKAGVGSDQLEFIYQIVFSNTFITLKQPEGEGIRKLLMGTRTESHLHSEAKETTGGFLSGLFRKR